MWCGTAPLARIRQSMDGLRRECTQMDIRVGVLQHILLSSRLKEKSRAGRSAAMVANDDDDENMLRGYWITRTQLWVLWNVQQWSPGVQFHPVADVLFSMVCKVSCKYSSQLNCTVSDHRLQNLPAHMMDRTLQFCGQDRQRNISAQRHCCKSVDIETCSRTPEALGSFSPLSTFLPCRWGNSSCQHSYVV